MCDGIKFKNESDKLGLNAGHQAKRGAFSRKLTEWQSEWLTAIERSNE